MPVGLIAMGVAAAGSATAKIIGAGQKEAAAKTNMERAVDYSDKLNKIAEATPQELQAIETGMRNAEITIQRERNVISQLDPTILEAGKQAYAMLNGDKEAGILSTIRRQRERQKQALSDNLRRQLGPGFETSSAGIEALNKFDLATDDAINGAQMGAINQLLGVTQNALGQSRQGEHAATGASFQAASAFGNIQQRKASAFSAGAQMVQQAGGAQVQAAGGVANAVGGAFNEFGKVAGFATDPSNFAPNPSSGGSGAPGLGVNTSMGDMSSLDKFKKIA